MREGKVYLMDCENLIVQECGDKRVKRRSVAMSYRYAMESDRDGVEKINWGRVNRAITARWSLSGLRWIKNHAHSGKCFTPTETEARRG